VTKPLVRPHERALPTKPSVTHDQQEPIAKTLEKKGDSLVSRMGGLFYDSVQGIRWATAYSQIKSPESDLLE